MTDFDSTIEAAGDRKQVGLPPRASDMLEELAETPWFKHQQDAFKVAVAVALARGLRPPETETESYGTKFGLGTLDPDQGLRDLVLALAPECGDRPYDYAQRLANKGVLYLHSELVERRRSLTEALGIEAMEDQTVETIPSTDPNQL